MAEQEGGPAGHQEARPQPRLQPRLHHQLDHHDDLDPHPYKAVGGGLGEERGWRGPRIVCLKRAGNGFGFTLRHFIVYPPESYTIAAGDRRLGLRLEGREDEPMDTIFVKSVRGGSPAALAGLATGDRILGVNGEPTAGRPYSHVVQLIQQSQAHLNLLVVSREHDLIQLYFGETAHNPSTNERPRLKSPEMSRASRHPSLGSPRRSMDSQTHLPTPHSGGRWEGGGVRSMDSSLDYEEEAGSYSLPTSLTSPGCRLSLDAGSGPHSSAQSSLSSLHTPTDDSLIISRIRKSFEQKEEFLRRPVVWAGSGGGGADTIPQREFYPRPPGRLQAPVWPPAIPASAVPPAAPPSPQPQPPSSPRGGSGNRCLARMGRVQEVSRTSPAGPAAIRLVSQRRNQFETGSCLADRTTLYRSELARLGTKNSVPNVAVRRREFESRAADWRTHRESRSLDSHTSNQPSASARNMLMTGWLVSGNRTVPVGNPKLHCEPPSDMNTSPTERERVLRPRSNSLETGLPEDSRRHKAVRQDSYLAAVNKFVVEEVRRHRRPTSERQQSCDERHPVRPTTLPLPRPVYSSSESGRGGGSESSGSTTPHSSPRLDSVLLRPKMCSLDSQDDERATRRVSYMRATWGDHLHMETDLPLSDTQTSYKSALSIPPCDKEIIIEGSLTCKVTQVEGKKSQDRSWRTVWAVLRGDTLYLFRERKDSTSETPVEHERVEMSGVRVCLADDYTKRRHVLRLSASASSSEVLLQAESSSDVTRWLHALHHDNNNTQGGSEAVAGGSSKGSIIKLTSFRNRSPTGQSPTIKARKPSQAPDGGLVTGGAKCKTWKGRMAKQLRKMGGSSPVSPTPFPDAATIGVPLDLCPMSSSNEFVPLLVELCTGIVEEKGLDIIGIYRVPGNTAAVSSLTEAVNRGLEQALLDEEQRWSDVNVISSLLKSFFRKLPDCLLTTELYPLFIDADKIEDQTNRVATLRKLVHELPDHNYHTLRHLMFHLKTVVKHSGVNKMEARNLAIVFGPTLIKAGDNNMTTMVNDMSHQCRIVETLILYVDWCFSEDSVDSLVVKQEERSGPEMPESETPSQTLLLDNIHKVEGLKESPTRDVSAKDIVSSIISAANRKMQKARTRKTIVSISEESLPAESDNKLKSDWKGWRSGRKERSGSAEEGSLSKGSVASRVSESVLFSGNVASKILSSNDSASEKESGRKTEEGEGEGSGGEALKEVVEGGTILSYTGLDQVTQERVRRFEMETKAMLLRENLRKRDEKDAAASGLTVIAQPITSKKEAADNIGKRLKTCKEVSGGSCVLRKGSLDSLKDANPCWPDDWPSTNQHECGDLVMTLTSTFDAKMKHLTGGESGPAEADCASPATVTTPTATTPTTTTPTTPTTPPDLQLQYRDPSLHKTCPPCIHLQSTEKEEKNKEGEDNEKETLTEKEEEKENCNSKLRRSESLNKREEKRELGKLRRTESLNKKEGKCASDKLKRWESLTKNEKTESNLNKRRQLEAGKMYKMKRKVGGSSERSIKRRHTVGGTKDLDKVQWLDNRTAEQERAATRRTSSPDLSRHVLMEVRPSSLVDPPSHRPLESHM